MPVIADHRIGPVGSEKESGDGDARGGVDVDDINPPMPV